MKRIALILFVFLCFLFSCTVEENRDQLVFKDDFEKVQNAIIEMEKLLIYIPQKVDSLADGYPYRNYIIQNGYFYINDDDKLFNLDYPDKNILINNYQFSDENATEFIKLAKFLYTNNVEGANKSCPGWGFFYKYSNDRGKFRLIKINHQGVENTLHQCYLKIIDKKGKLLLLK